MRTPAIILSLALLSATATAQVTCTQAGNTTTCNGALQQQPSYYDISAHTQPQNWYDNYVKGQQAGQQARQRQTDMQQQQAFEAQQQAYAAQVHASQEQQQRDAQLRAIASQLFQAAPEDRPALLGQMAALDPSMALQYQQMFASQQASVAVSMHSVYKCAHEDGTIVYTNTASVGCVEVNNHDPANASNARRSKASRKPHVSPERKDAKAL